MSAILDAFGERDDGLDHDWSAWSIQKDPSSIAVEERICMSCGHRELRKAPLGPYEQP